jgi:hypothetical protein
MKTIAKFGLAALAAGAFFGGTLLANADQYASQLSNPFTKHGLPIPGAYFKAKESQQRATIAVSKSGVGVGQANQTAWKTENGVVVSTSFRHTRSPR